MKKIVIFTTLFLIMGTAVFAQSDLQPLANIKVGAKAETITLKQLKNRVEAYQKQAQGTIFTLEQRKEILDAMIDEKLVVQTATKAGMSVTDSQANEYFLQSLAQQVGQPVTEQQFATLIKQQTNMSLDEFFKKQVGMSVAEYKVFMKNQLLAQQYIISQKQNELVNVAPTDAEVRAFYEMNKASFVLSDMLKLFLVVVPKMADAKAAEKTATSLLNDLKTKKTTEEKLKAKMTDEKAGFQAGDILVTKNVQAAQQLGIDYNALITLFTKDKGYYSDVTETDSDFQFYMIREKYDAKMLGLSDIVQPDTIITVYEYIKTNLTEQKQAEFLGKAAEEITKTLRTPANFQMVKTGAALDKLLDW
ncbi:MAG: peptidyl-prolyl cis-trans isomerase [Treponema sp.]|nr:peptidyl-prolyl cis-trans isomerase [Treponema sp.]